MSKFWAFIGSAVLVLLLLVVWAVPAGAQVGTGSETVLFDQTFSGPDSPSPGPAWQEFLVRRSENGAIPGQGDTPWQIRGNTLYFQATGDNSYIEDFVQTVDEFPVDNTRIEFEIRAKGGTRLGYIGPVAVWAGSPGDRRDAMNVVRGYPLVGVEAWYRWENAGTKGLFLLGIKQPGDHPNLFFSGLNQPGFARHVITISGGKLTYQSPDCPPVTYDLKYPLEPGAKRQFSFGARLYDRGVGQTIEIRNFKITALPPREVELTPEARACLEGELGVLSGELSTRVDAGMAPLVKQQLAIVQGRLKNLEPRVKIQLEPMIAGIKNSVQAEVDTQVSAASQLLGGGILNISALNPEMAEMVQAQAASMVQSIVEPAARSRADSIMQTVKPQVQSIVQAEADPLVGGIQGEAEKQAQAIVAELNSFIDSRLVSIMEVIKPMVAPNPEESLSAGDEAGLRAEIEAEIKPQITAMLEQKIQSVIDNQILTSVEGQVMELARSLMQEAAADIASYTESRLSGLPVPAAVEIISGVIAETVLFLDAYIQSEVQATIRNYRGRPVLVQVLVNGKQVSYDVLPIIKDGRTLVPLRAIAQSLGAQVSWDPQKQMVVLTRGNTVVRLTLNSLRAMVNDREVSLDVPAQVVNDRTLVPARFISEILGAGVGWDGQSKTVTVLADDLVLTDLVPPGPDSAT